MCILVACALGCGHSPAAIPTASSIQTQRKAVNLPKYVIVMIQENRSVDNLFQTQPGVDTQNFGFDSHHNRIPLTMVDLNAQFDCDHAHVSFVRDVQVGFDTEPCGTGAPPDAAYSYVNPSQITQYTALATQYAFADEVLQDNQGPSFPAHIYLIAGTSGSPGTNLNISEESGKLAVDGPPHRPSGCDAPPGSHDVTMDMTSTFPGKSGKQIFPCLTAMTILDELDGAHVSWKYYTSNLDGPWTSPYAIKSLYTNDRSKVIAPETKVLSDIQNGKLAQVSFVTPNSKNSDHPKAGKGGPTWVASVINALGTSQYWGQCAIIVVWDDWGGFYDHVNFRFPVDRPNDPYEYGFRVPLLAIGPFAKPGFVDHTQRDFAAIPHFIEDVYGLPSLGQLDAQTDDLFSMFNFGSQPRKYKWIPTGDVTIKSIIDSPPDPVAIDSE